MTVLISLLDRRSIEKYVDAREKEKAFHAYGTRGVLDRDRRAVQVSRLHSPQYPRGVLPPTPLPIPPDYSHNLRRRPKMATKGIWLPPMKIILNTYTTHCLLSRHGRRHNATYLCDDRLYSSCRRSRNVMLPGGSQQRNRRWWKMFVWRNTPRAGWTRS